jgi:dephospho-CoA kinase
LASEAIPKKQPFVVAITGGIGSGKSTVAKLFVAQGVEVVDSDALSHALTLPGGIAIPAISAAFGPQFIEADGRMNRTAMREIVFSDASAKLKLESILHPLIRAASAQAMARAAAKSPYVMVDIPLLVETSENEDSWAKRANRILVVDCPVEMQIQRVISRSAANNSNAMSVEQVRAIIAKQAPREAKLALATDVIVNDKTADELYPQVQGLHILYLRLSRAAV